MLVLTRKLQETIRIGDEITIYVLRVKGNTVRLGIDAPRRVRVIRGELADKTEVITGPTLPDTETGREDPPAEESPVTSSPALSRFFPRVLSTEQFPAPSLDPNQGAMGP